MFLTSPYIDQAFTLKTPSMSVIEMLPQQPHNFRFADNPEVIARWLESKCRVRHFYQFFLSASEA